MKHDDRDGLDFRLLKGFFQQAPRDPGQTIVDLGQQFDFLRAQSRSASLAAQQLGEGGGQRGKAQQMTTLRLVVVDAAFRLLAAVAADAPRPTASDTRDPAAFAAEAAAVADGRPVSRS